MCFVRCKRTRCQQSDVLLINFFGCCDRTYIFHTREGYMLSDTDSDPLPREVVNENVSYEPHNKFTVYFRFSVILYWCSSNSSSPDHT